ncbi:DUF362 domain-containing protein [bacterium]|nr:DUF362 domain-containing protein [bacterium]
MTVVLSEVRDYDLAVLRNRIAGALAELDMSFAAARTALIKPNIVTGRPPSSGVVTNPAVVEALVMLLRDAGVGEITIADGPGIGLDPEWVFEKSGYRALADRLGVRLETFNGASRRMRPWKFGEVGIPEMLEDADIYINVPKMKTHGYTTVTLAIKNHKGMLSQADKKLDHHLGLHDPLAQQAKLRPPDLVVLDGIVGIEGDGPLNGRRVRSRVLAVGTNMLEVDATGARHMGIDPNEITHLRLAAEAGVGTMDPEIIGDAPTRDFKRANEEFGRVANIYSWRDCTACSMCIDSFGGAMSLAVREPRYWFTLVPKLAWWGIIGGLHIVQGRNGRIPNRRGKMVCFGRCTRELAEREGIMHIKGCPPTAREVAETLRKEL